MRVTSGCPDFAVALTFAGEARQSGNGAVAAELVVIPRWPNLTPFFAGYSLYSIQNNPDKLA